MKQWNVTITGADDAVDPSELAKLSEEFPFVEWGILLSPTRRGRPRYPTHAWQLKLGEVAESTSMNLSAHVCGDDANHLMVGNDLDEVTNIAPRFQRVQINGFKHTAVFLEAPPSKEFILQARSEGELLNAARYIQERPAGRYSVLFDPSGGRGHVPDSWPRGRLDIRMGYAGGITPDNVLTVMGDIMLARGTTTEPTWIDMETGVRDGDAFDLDKVRRVLEQVAKVNAALGT